MPRNATARILPACALAVTLTAVSCSGGPESASATHDASPPGPAATPSVPAAPRPATEQVTSDQLASGGFFDVNRSDLTFRHGPSGTTIRGDFRATARQASQSFELDYCGPPLVFLSIDGSTVETIVHEGTLRAPLHLPLEPGDDFSFRFLTVVPRDEAAPRDIAEVADGLFCR